MKSNVVFNDPYLDKKNIILNLTFNFSIQIIKLYKHLNLNKEFVIAKQVLRCGTSIGANVAEATAGYSKKDFAAKMSIASKEARETKYWLMLLNTGELLTIDVNEEIKSINHIINILTKIVKTAQSTNKTLNT